MTKKNLSDYRAECVKTFGENSEAVRALDQQIEQQGGDTAVEVEEKHFTGLLAMLDFWKRHSDD